MHVEGRGYKCLSILAVNTLVRQGGGVNSLINYVHNLPFFLTMG